MKASFYTGNQTFEVRDVTPAEPGEGEVRVRVAYCGICGTDLHIFHGKMDQRVGIPQTIGHEMSGVVEKTGPGVTAFRPGDRVAVRPLDWCGDCPACRAGHSHICMNLKFMGIDSVGAFQELWVVKERTLFRVPDNLSLRLAALIEPLAVACHDVRTAAIRPGETVVVLGGGPIGLLIAMVARAAGGNVILSEINPYRIATARELGFRTVDPAGEDLKAIVEATTVGAGADVVFEVTASAAGAKTMTELVRTRGRIVAVGIYSRPPEVDMHRFFWRELRLFGARLYEEEDFRNGLELAATGKLPLERLITGVLRLDEIQKAFESFNGNAEAMKVLIQCSDEVEK